MNKTSYYLLSVLFALLFSLSASAQITGTPTVCVGSTTALSGTPSGGSWMSSNPSIAVVSVTTGVVHGMSPGVAAISYTAGMTVTTVLVTVNTTPSAGSITGSSTVCVGASTTFVATIPGGVWAASNANATVSGGIITGVSVGLDTISYTVTNTCGSATTTKIVSINPLPVAGTVSGLSSVCVGATVTLTPSVSGGAWSVSNPSAAVTAGVVTGVSAGVDTIMYSVTNSCGTAVATHTVTIDPLPSAGAISGLLNVCPGATITLTPSVSGGTWAASNAMATVSGGVVSGVTPGIDTITYTVTDVCGSDAVSVSVTVDPLPVAGTISGASSVCEAASITFTATIPGGAWSAATGAAMVSGGIVTGVSAGVDTIIYTITTACGSAATTAEVTVNPLPFAGFVSGPGDVCNGSSITLTTGVSGGVWGSSDVSVATVDASGNVSGILAGTSTIFYAVSNSCGVDTAWHFVTVDDPAGPIAGPGVVCQFAFITLTNDVPGGTWSSSDPLTAFVFGGTVIGGITTGMATITYTVVNACGTTEATKDVLVINCILSEPQLTTVKTEMQLSPNPGNGIFTLNISSPDREDVQVTVSNMVGETVKQFSAVTNTSTEVTLDVPTGIYFVSAKAKSGITTTKLVVQ